MLSLTPLRFGRSWKTGSVIYGEGEYLTDCGRFSVWEDHHNQWRISDANADWYDWLEQVDLIDARFGTRRQSLEVLTAALSADSLLDSNTPSTY